MTAFTHGSIEQVLGSMTSSSQPAGGKRLLNYNLSDELQVASSCVMPILKQVADKLGGFWETPCAMALSEIDMVTAEAPKKVASFIPYFKIALQGLVDETLTGCQLNALVAQREIMKQVGEAIGLTPLRVVTESLGNGVLAQLSWRVDRSDGIPTHLGMQMFDIMQKDRQLALLLHNSLDHRLFDDLPPYDMRLVINGELKTFNTNHLAVGFAQTIDQIEAMTGNG